MCTGKNSQENLFCCLVSPACGGQQQPRKSRASEVSGATELAKSSSEAPPTHQIISCPRHRLKYFSLIFGYFVSYGSLLGPRLASLALEKHSTTELSPSLPQETCLCYFPSPSPPSIGGQRYLLSLVTGNWVLPPDPQRVSCPLPSLFRGLGKYSVNKTPEAQVLGLPEQRDQ